MQAPTIGGVRVRKGDGEVVRLARGASLTDFAEKINRVTRDEQLAGRFGLAGRQRCIEEFSWAKIAAETVAVYEKAIAHHQSK